MIVAVVQFPTGTVSREETRARFRSTAPRYQDVEGLVRKYYLLSEDGTKGGGVYLFRSKDEAQRLYNDEWLRFIRSTYGTDPIIEYYECPVVVDNATREIATREIQTSEPA